MRKWKETDAESMFEYAKDPEVGPIAGWPPHKSVEESLNVIRNGMNGAECYAICEKESGKAIGAIELKLNGHTDMTQRDDECELGYCLSKPFWGRGYMPEAVEALLRHGFEDLGMNIIWCGYYDGNQKSKRVQEKLGFVYHHTTPDVPVPLLDEVRVCHANIMTRERWEEIRVWEKLYERAKIEYHPEDVSPFIQAHLWYVPWKVRTGLSIPAFALRRAAA